MTSTLRKRYITRSTTSPETSDNGPESPSSPDSYIVDLTVGTAEQSNEDSSSDTTHQSHEFSSTGGNLDFGTMKSEVLNEEQVLSFIIALSCLPFMIIVSYSIFPTITLLCTAPWFVIMYGVRTYGSGKKPVEWSDFISMITIMYYRSKDYIQVAYQSI